jgi:hypothetical protein
MNVGNEPAGMVKYMTAMTAQMMASRKASIFIVSVPVLMKRSRIPAPAPRLPGLARSIGIGEITPDSFG